MKEISKELCERDVAICVRCGAIVEVEDSTSRSCPECKEELALRWVTLDHCWIREFRGLKHRKRRS